jgi:TMEM175 potassium channel family protein
MKRKNFLSKPVTGSESDHQSQLGLERLIFFSDAVFAIAITLLALEIRLPAGETINSEVDLFNRLVGIWHSYLAYIISFMVIGTFWIGHHRKFRFIKRYDGRLLLLNLLFLMMIAFIPFPSSIISEYPGRTATIFYALTMLVVALIMIGIWWYASWHNRLTDFNLKKIERRRQFISPLITSAIFIFSIGIAFIDPDIAKFSWLLLLINALVIHRST